MALYLVERIHTIYSLLNYTIHAMRKRARILESHDEADDDDGDDGGDNGDV